MSRTALTVITAASLLVACSKTVVVSSPGPESAESSTNGKSTAATLGIPPGHLPKPGQCRIWFPGKPPGKQGLPGDCARLAKQVPLGAWLVHRPSDNKKEVKVSIYDRRTPRLVVTVRYFDYASRTLLREEKPGKKEKPGRRR